jgi:hypothetical protein
MNACDKFLKAHVHFTMSTFSSVIFICLEVICVYYETDLIKSLNDTAEHEYIASSENFAKKADILRRKRLWRN